MCFEKKGNKATPSFLYWPLLHSQSGSVWGRKKKGKISRSQDTKRKEEILNGIIVVKHSNLNFGL